MKTDNDFLKEYHLSTEGYYFKYRKDNNDSTIIRATLFNTKDEKVDDIRKSAGYGFPEKTHEEVINYFESRLSLKIVK